MKFSFALLIMMAGPLLPSGILLAGAGEDAWKVYESGDHKKAFSLALPAAGAGDPAAQRVVGYLYLYGHGVAKDYDQAIAWLRKSARQGDAAAEQSYGWMLENGWGAKKDLAEAAEWYRKSAEQGNHWGQGALGWCYLDGKGVSKDLAKAEHWLRKAAEQGNQHAQTGLGWLYNNGWHVKQDYAEAAKWYRLAADQGNQYAQNDLGWFYQNGWGVKQDLGRAFDLYSKAAAQGNHYSQNALANLYFNGNGVAKDMAKAADLWQKSAEQGNIWAPHGIGHLKRVGQGIAQDYAEALKWFKLGIERGELAYCPTSLAMMYENGEGVVQDYVEAYKWYAIGSAHNHAYARDSMTRLRALMTKEQVAEAQKAASAFEAKPPIVPRAAGPDTIISDVDLPSFRTEEAPNRFALVVGVEKYKDLPPADFAERDSEAVAEHFAALGVARRNVIHLRGQNATISGLRKYLDEWLPRNAGAGSTVFFYFSGHGAPDPDSGDSYLLPWDGDPSYLKSTAYPIKKLYLGLANLKADKVWVVLDACFSGAGGRSVLAKGTRPLVTKLDAASAPGGKMTVFSAAGGNQVTGTLEDQGHGLFTYYFLKGLNELGRASKKTIPAAGIHEFLSPRVQDAARRQNREQSPLLLGDSGSVISR